MRGVKAVYSQAVAEESSEGIFISQPNGGDGSVSLPHCDLSHSRGSPSQEQPCAAGSQHHDCRQVPAELSVPTCTTRNTHRWIIHKGAAWVRTDRHRLSTGSTRQAAWTQELALENLPNTPRKHHSTAGRWASWPRQPGSDVCKSPSGRHTRLGPACLLKTHRSPAAPQPAVCCTRDGQAKKNTKKTKNQGKHSTEDQFKL